MHVSGLAPGVVIDYSRITDSSLLIQAGASFDYTFNSAPTTENNIPAQAPTIDIDGLGECVTSNFESLRSDRMAVSIDAGIGKMINRILYSVKLNYRYLDIDAGIRCHSVALTLGATF